MTMLDDRIGRAAAKGLVRAIRNGYTGSESEWLWRWLDRAGVEPPDMPAFVCAVIARAHWALGADIICTGYGPDPKAGRS